MYLVVFGWRVLAALTISIDVFTEIQVESTFRFSPELLQQPQKKKKKDFPCFQSYFL